ncbi:MAG: methyltransferase domain-containing protein [Ferruginibacter sp.]
MALVRKRLQGITNIVRFNWHFYALSILVIFLLVLLRNFTSGPAYYFLNVLSWIICILTLISLFTSMYVYDISNLYTFNWLDKSYVQQNGDIVNINAGFDEISSLISEKYSPDNLHIFDFYDPKKHTEISIKRARNAYPPYIGTISINTTTLPVKDNSIDNIFLFLSAHEIRNEQEKNIFFKELNRIIKPTGKLIVTEHLRDVPNFIAYNIGFFHFFPKSGWLKVFNLSKFNIEQEIKITPFISSFILEKNAAST